MNTKTQKLKNEGAHTQGIGEKWLSGPNLIILSLLLLFPMLHIRSAFAAEINETKMGEALMQMEEGATDALTRATSEGWRTCEVKMTGAGWGNIYLRLVCNGVSERWFIARKDQEKEMLATGLTAITLNKKVQAYLAHMPSGYHEVQACYVMK